VSYTKDFREHCTAEMKRLCPHKLGPAALMCLKEQKDRIHSAECKEEIGRVQRMQANDMSMDVPFYTACAEDLNNTAACLKFKGMGGRKACLKRHRTTLSEKCKQALFLKEAEDGEDLRTNIDVLDSCTEETNKFCEAVGFGKARMSACLWSKRASAGFGLECKKKTEELVNRQVQDFRLDWRVKTYCNKTVHALCSEEMAEAEIKTPNRTGGKVMHCLKKQYEHITEEACLTEIVRVVRVQSAEPAADPVHKEKCDADIKEFCALATSNEDKTEVHRCLRRNLDKISVSCKDAELLQGFLESTNVGMKEELSTFCGPAMKTFCKDEPVGDGRVIKCLQEKSKEKDFPENCGRVVKADLHASNHDWRLKYGMSVSCKIDAALLCSEEVDIGGTRLLSCLATNKLKVKNQRCGVALSRYVKQGLSNIKASPGTYSACVGDVEDLCPDTEAGNGAIHRCLVKYKDLLSEGCSKAEFKLQKLKFGDISLSDRAMVTCKSAMKMLCPDTQIGGGEMWSCLEDHRTEVRMGDKCRQIIDDHIRLKNSEFSLNPALAKHCQEAAKTHCPTELKTSQSEDFTSNGGVIGCLVFNREKVTDELCKNDLIKKQTQRITSLRNDPAAFMACQEDAWSYCEVEMYDGTTGRVQKCLRTLFEAGLKPEEANSARKLSPECKTTMRAVVAMESEDIRLNTRMNADCQQARAKYCKVPPGRAISCLLEHMHGSSMGSSCHSILEKETVKRAHGLKFNPGLNKQCKDELQKLVKENKCSEIVTDESGSKVDCLTRNRKDVTDEKCTAEIVKVQKQQSADIRAKPGMHHACKAEMARLCPGVSFGGGHVQSCLRGKQSSIRDEKCKKFVKEVRSSESGDARLNPAVGRDCVNERKAYCNHVESGKARVLVCLSTHKSSEGFSAACRMALSKIDIDQKLVAGQKGADDARVQSAVNDATKEIKAWIWSRAPSFEDGSGTFVAGGIIGAMVACALVGLLIHLSCRKWRSNYAGLHPDTAGP